MSIQGVLASSVWNAKALQGFCDFYARNKAVTVEVLSINMPRTLIVRNKNEMIDTAFNEFMNSMGYFGGLKLLGMGMDRVMKTLFPRIVRHPAAHRFAKTAFLVPAFMGYMVAMPFYRNALTAWRSKTLDFRDLITKEQHHDPRHWREFADRNLERGHLAFLVGVALGLVGLVYGVGRPIHISRWARQAKTKKVFDEPSEILAMRIFELLKKMPFLNALERSQQVFFAEA